MGARLFGRARQPLVVPVAVAAVALVLLLGFTTPIAAADSCANAAFRTGASVGLPDCRAYELVTPPFKFGIYTKGGTAELLDGSHLKTSSVGGFAEPGANQSSQGADYILGRSEASGWSAMPTDLPSSAFWGGGGLSAPPQQVVDVSRDFSRALIAADPIGSTPGSIESKPINLRFYIRRPATSEVPCSVGEIPVAGACAVEVGPAVPPATVAAWKESAFNEDAQRPRISYRGASRDLGHIFFSSQGPEGAEDTNWLWPGDTTIRDIPPRESLYEYSGTGGSPRLVGVSSAPEPQLISQCGTYLGSFESGNTHHAIAAEGNTLFFTAGAGGCEHGGQTGTGPKVNELYARVGGAATVAISEPSLLVPGRECTGACRESENEENGHERSEGIFVGACEDGSKVFFLTKQALLNSDEGGTGTGQDLYEAELEGGAIKRLVQVSHDPNAGEAAEVQGAVRVSDEGTRVYFVATGVLATNKDAKGEAAIAGGSNLYVYEPDPARPGQFKTVFIATLSASDEFDWGAGRGGGGAGPVEVTPRTANTADGQFLLFASRNDPTPDAKGEGKQLYRFDAQEEKLVRISIGEGGFNDNEEGSEFIVPAPAFTSEAYAGPQGVAISDDGAFVFFESETGLTPLALNKQVAGCASEEAGKCSQPFNAQNVYEYHEGHVYLISDGQDRHALERSSAVRLIGANASGHDVYLTAADQLVPRDTDSQVDIYDARVGGGFPGPATPVLCQADACQGSVSGAPSLPSPGSASFSGPGNLVVGGKSGPKPGKSGPKPLTRAQKLAKALSACRKRPKKQRAACVRRAKKRYAAKSNVAHRNGRGR